MYIHALVMGTETEIRMGLSPPPPLPCIAVLNSVLALERQAWICTA